jgi:hypothetical protein
VSLSDHLLKSVGSSLIGAFKRQLRLNEPSVFRCGGIALNGRSWPRQSTVDAVEVRLRAWLSSSGIRAAGYEVYMIELDPGDSLALTLHHAPGVQALLVGSGLSRSAGIPTGWEITFQLIRRLAIVQGVSEELDWASWYQSTYSKAPSYSEILDALAVTPSERRAIIHGFIEPHEGEEARRPTKAHQAIARLVKSGKVRVILTTNFDRLLESALRDEGVEPTIIASEDALQGAAPLRPFSLHDSKVARRLPRRPHSQY